MKPFYLSVLLVCILQSCQKELRPRNSTYIETVRQGLADSLSSSDLLALDFSNAALSRIDSADLFFLRVPFRQRKGQENFVLVKTDKKGKIETGKIVLLEGRIRNGGWANKAQWDGQVSLTSLDRKTVFQSTIVNGYITALHAQNLYRTESQEPQGDMMPEVIITYTIPSGGGGVSPSSWYLLNFFTSATANGGTGGGGYYSDFSGGGSTVDGGGGSSNYGSNSGSLQTDGGSSDPVLLVDRETQDEEAPIDIEKFLKCFSAIPDAGATCSIELLADIPVDSDPNRIFNFTSRSPGHTFLNIRKSNGSSSVSQNIGFYPFSGWKTILTNAPIDGKFVNNGRHEFNCGFRLNITPAQLQSAIMEMLRTMNYKYDIDNYNCTDWAMDVFNAAGGNLQIPLYDIPGNVPSVGTRTPNGVYNKLRDMKNSGDPRSAGITINLVKGFAGNSTGPCN